MNVPGGLQPNGSSVSGIFVRKVEREARLMVDLIDRHWVPLALALHATPCPVLIPTPLPQSPYISPQRSLNPSYAAQANVKGG